MKVLVIAIIGMFILSGIALVAAQDDMNVTNAEDPAITEGGSISGLDRALENVQLALTFNKEKRAERALLIAEERLAEVRDLVEQKRFEQLDKAEERQEKALDRAQKAIERIQSNNDAKNDLEKLIKLQEKIE